MKKTKSTSTREEKAKVEAEKQAGWNPNGCQATTKKNFQCTGRPLAGTKYCGNPAHTSLGMSMEEKKAVVDSLGVINLELSLNQRHISRPELLPFAVTAEGATKLLDAWHKICCDKPGEIYVFLDKLVPEGKRTYKVGRAELMDRRKKQWLKCYPHLELIKTYSTSRNILAETLIHIELDHQLNGSLRLPRPCKVVKCEKQKHIEWFAHDLPRLLLIIEFWVSVVNTRFAYLIPTEPRPTKSTKSSTTLPLSAAAGSLRIITKAQKSISTHKTKGRPKGVYIPISLLPSPIPRLVPPGGVRIDVQQITQPVYKPIVDKKLHASALPAVPKLTPSIRPTVPYTVQGPSGECFKSETGKITTCRVFPASKRFKWNCCKGFIGYQAAVPTHHKVHNGYHPNPLDLPICG